VAGLKEKFDLAFIDGAHDAPSVKLDASLATAALAPGGLLAFHDFRNFPGEHDGNWDPGVTQTVNELIAQGASLVDKIGTIAVVRPAA
jgi:predicted O-methyltransferase YrrM